MSNYKYPLRDQRNAPAGELEIRSEDDHVAIDATDGYTRVSIVITDSALLTHISAVLLNASIALRESEDEARRMGGDQ